MNPKLKIILTGATGMVGEGVLNECLKHPAVEQVLIVNRKPSGVTHPKLKEIIQHDFFNLQGVEDQFSGYNACFFCLGVTSIGLKEPEYTHLTYDLTLNFAKTVVAKNTDMVFCYVSGSGTDSTEKGRSMWARVKGRTENALLKLPFKKVYLYRPGYMQPTPGLKNTLSFYKYVSWLYPFLQLIGPGFACTLRELGLSMIHCALAGDEKQIMEVRDIVRTAKEEIAAAK